MDLSTLVLILLALGGFGAQPNANAPSAAEVLRFAPDDADAMVYFDLEAVVPKNYDVLLHLPDDPSIRSLPEGTRRAIGDVVREAEQAWAEARDKLGLDPVHDLKSVAVFITLRARGEPQVALAARGRFSAAALAKVAASEPKARKETVGGRTLYLSPDREGAVALVDDTTRVARTVAWVRERARAGFKPTSGRGPLATQARAPLEDKPIFLIASRPSVTALRFYTHEMSDPEGAFLRDVMIGHESATFSVLWNGLAWSYTARTAAGYGRAVMATEGIIQLLRAGQLGLRGMARVALAAVDSYAQDPTVAQIVAHKADLLRIVDTWSGDGTFASNIERKDAERRVSVRLTGKSLSEVLPIAGLAAIGGLGAALWH